MYLKRLAHQHIHGETRALALIHLSNILFAATALLIALLSQSRGGYYTSFARFLVGTLLAFSHLALHKKPFVIHRKKPWIGRGIFGALAMTLYYVSIDLGTAGRASLFNNSFPIFVAIIAIAFLKEPVFPVTILSIIIAFAGVALVLADGSRGNVLADIAGLASGMIAGLSYHFNKKASMTEDPVIIYLGVCLVGMLFNAHSLFPLSPPNPSELVILALAGLGAYWAQVAITAGLRDIDTTRGSIHTFFKIPLTIAGGIIFFSNTVTLRFIAGSILLVTGILLDRLVRIRPEG